MATSIPTRTDRRIAIHVTTAAERNLRHGHPWLYSDGVTRLSPAGEPGDLAVIYDKRNKFLAVGLYDPSSPIRVRILHHGASAPIDRSWYIRKFAAAAKIRKPLEAQGTTGYRLIHGENDGLPGVVVDRYHSTLVMKLYTAAWIPHVERLLEALGEVEPAKRVVLRLSRAVQAQSPPRGIADGTVIAGPPVAEPIVFEEHGLRFEVDPIHGQKTGFFLDQRDNRAQTESLCRGGSVLDAFAYTGAFSVYAARGGARAVTSVDVSRDALQAAAANLARNRRFPAVAKTRHRTIEGDAFEVLEALGRKRAEFDVVILDPPAFAKTRNERAGALSAYRRLAMLGLGVLRRGGTLVAASCSTQMTAPDFFRTVREAAGRSRRRLKELARTGHALDHPIGFREGAYLKCLFSVVQ